MFNTANENPATPTLVKRVTLKQVLGRIDAPGCVIEGVPAANNTRWIFDINGETGKDIEISLLEFRSGKRIKLDLSSIALTAQSAEFYEAKPHFVLVNNTLVLRSDKINAACKYRVSVDILHTATR